MYTQLGPQGAQGPQGTQGTQGPQGPQGAASTVAGPQGSQGPQGAAGTNGTNGTNGSQGAQGPQGAGVPTGGAAGDFLTKIDATNYNTQWTTTLPIAQGGTGATTGSGLIPVIPASVTVVGAGSSASVDATTGTVTYAAATSISLNTVFSTSYTAYRIVYRNTVGNANDSTLSLRIRSNTTDFSGALYDTASIVGTANSSTAVVNNGSALTSLTLANNYSNGNYMTLDVFNPAQTLVTGISGLGLAELTSVFRGWTTLGRVRNTTSYNGITFFISAGTIGGTITVYGYKA
jgi:hypothetical protein